MANANSVNANQQGTQYLSSLGVWSGIDGGSSGDVLTSNGTGVAPSFQPGGGSGTYYSVTPYICGQDGDTHAQFTGGDAILDALAQIVTDNPPAANVYIKPGYYAASGDLVIPAGITVNFIGLCNPCLIGSASFFDATPSLQPSVIIAGNLLSADQFTAQNITFQSGLFSLVAGTQLFSGCDFTGITIKNNPDEDPIATFLNCYMGVIQSQSVVDTAQINFNFQNCVLANTIACESTGPDILSFTNCCFLLNSKIENSTQSDSPQVSAYNCTIFSSIWMDETNSPSVGSIINIDNLFFNSNVSYAFIIGGSTNFQSVTNCTFQNGSRFMQTLTGANTAVTINNCALLGNVNLDFADSTMDFTAVNCVITSVDGSLLGASNTILYRSCDLSGSTPPTVGMGTTVTYINTMNEVFQYQSDRTDNSLVVTGAGYVTYPFNALFIGSLDGGGTTGDGTVVTIAYTPQLDNQSGWGGTSYTIPANAPIGFWKCHARVELSGMGITHTSGVLTINVCGTEITTFFNPYAMADTTTGAVTIEAYGVIGGISNASSPNTITVTVAVDGGTATVDVDPNQTTCSFEFIGNYTP